MRQETILREAEFNPKVVDYWLLSGTVVLCCTIIGIPFGFLWYVVGRGICKKYLARISCTLTDRSLIIRKGMFNRIEKTIPLDKITDLALLQGPIMRAMNLQGFKVETAGGAGAATGGYLVQLTGIVDTEAFRDAVLSQRDAREDRRSGTTPTPPTTLEMPGTPGTPQSSANPDMAELIQEIRRYAPKPNGSAGPAEPSAQAEETLEILREIRDSLKAIEARGT